MDKLLRMIVSYSLHGHLSLYPARSQLLLPQTVNSALCISTLSLKIARTDQTPPEVAVFKLSHSPKRS